MARNQNLDLSSSERRDARINRARKLEAGITALTDNLFPKNTDDSAQLVTASRVLPSRVYEGVQGGPNWSRTYETQAGVPIDGGNAIARDPRYGSPFIFRILPNATLVDSLLNEQDDAGVNIIGAAQKADNTFKAYTEKLDNLRLGQSIPGFSATPSIENYIASGTLINQFNVNSPETYIPAVADTVAQADILLQLIQMINTPPLTLLINPQNLTINHSKKQNYTERSRFNYIFQSWGEEQVRISVTGKTGAFIVGEPPTNFHSSRGKGGTVIETGTATGVQFAAKRDSAAFQNLMNLLLFYRNNGYIYDRIGKSEAHHWIGNVAIDYDQFTYIGNFESFEYSYQSEQQNGGIDFSFEFTASQIYDNAQRVFYVSPIESPVPSPSDTQWAFPGPRNRKPGRTFRQIGDFINRHPTIQKQPSPSSEGNNPFGGRNFGTDAIPPSGPFSTF